MKKTLVIVVLLSAFWFDLCAQDICGTPAITSFENVKKLFSHQKRTANSTYALRLYFHVIRSSSGTGGVSSSNVSNAYNRLNYDFNDHGIFFFWDENIDYIDNNTYYDSIPDTKIFNVNSHSNGIDIYLFPAFPNYSHSFSGLANGIGMNSEYLVVGNFNGTPACMTSTISHEMGHVLNLWHTHHGTFNEGGNDNPCPELVNGSNSSTCGDYVEDTPADPRLLGKVNDFCLYTGSETDANNQAYTPDVDLIMSYAPNSCRTRFSIKQGERMKDAIENLPHLMQVKYSGVISGPSLVCSPSAGPYTVNNLPDGFSVSWHFEPTYSTLDSLIHSDYPAQNQCTVSAGNGIEFSAVLQAIISFNGNNIATLSKAINTPYDFYGTFSQTPQPPNKHHYPTISETSFYDDYQFIVNPDCNIVIKSAKFRNMSISCSSSDVNVYKVDDETITFYIPYVPAVTHFTIYATSTNGCGNFSFLVSPTYLPLNILNDIVISQESQNLCIALPSLNDWVEKNENIQKSASSQTSKWYIKITNAITGQTVFSGNPSENNLIIDTSSWSSGVYVINFTIDNITTSKKINIKK